MREKRTKKRLSKNKKNEEIFEYSENEEQNKTDQIEAKTLIDLKDNSSLFFDFIYDLHSIEGTKGHQNFISNQTIDQGVFYFEVLLKPSKFNINKDFLEKKFDEFEKKYYEPIFSNPINYSPNIRIGISESKSDLDIPVGVDKNSYSIRVGDGAIISEGNLIGLNEKLEEGDVIGVLINIKPPMPDFFKKMKIDDGKENENNEEERRINFESFLKFYKNGNEFPVGIKGIREGSYNVLITLYNFASAEVNFGKNLRFFDKLNSEENIQLLKNFLK